MEFKLDLADSLQGRIGTGNSVGGNDVSQLDWPGLHARLTAAYDTRRELLRHEIAKAGASGSFDRNAAATLSAASYASYLVNPTDLADGKVQSCIEANVAEPNIGDQGK
jgi:hypothetical protein